MRKQSQKEPPKKSEYYSGIGSGIILKKISVPNSFIVDFDRKIIQCTRMAYIFTLKQKTACLCMSLHK